MNAIPSIAIKFLDGPGSRYAGNGVIKRRLALLIDGQEKDVVTLRLDSDQSRSRQAKRWANTFKVDAAIIEEKLRAAAFVAVEESQKPKVDRKVGGTESPTTPITLHEARRVFSKWLSQSDADLLDVVFGAILAHRLDGDPVWLFIIGAPGDGKTEVLRALSKHSEIHTLSTLTPGSLISGYITDGPDPSLLPQLDGKVLVVKDFTAILEMPNEARSEVLGTLRDAYDGEAGKAFGTGEMKRYQSRFGLVAAVTPVIDRYWGVSAQLGERFLRFRLTGGGRSAKVRRALGNANEEKPMRAALSVAALGVLAQDPPIPTVPACYEERLIALADFVSLARSEVARDRQGVVLYVPAPEVGTRVGKAMKKLCMGISMARGLKAVDDDVYKIVARVALDTIPSMRARLLRVLWNRRVAFDRTADIAEDAEVGTETAKVWLDDLRLIGIVQRGGDPRAGYTWNLSPAFQETVQAAALSGAWGVPPDSYPPTAEADLTDVMGGGGESYPPTKTASKTVRGQESPPPPLSLHPASENAVFDPENAGPADSEAESPEFVTAREEVEL